MQNFCFQNISYSVGIRTLSAADVFDKSNLVLHTYMVYSNSGVLWQSVGITRSTRRIQIATLRQ